MWRWQQQGCWLLRVELPDLDGIAAPTYYGTEQVNRPPLCTVLLGLPSTGSLLSCASCTAGNQATFYRLGNRQSRKVTQN